MGASISEGPGSCAVWMQIVVVAAAGGVVVSLLSSTDRWDGNIDFEMKAERNNLDDIDAGCACRQVIWL